MCTAVILKRYDSLILLVTFRNCGTYEWPAEHIPSPGISAQFKEALKDVRARKVLLTIKQR